MDQNHTKPEHARVVLRASFLNPCSGVLLFKNKIIALYIPHCLWQTSQNIKDLCTVQEYMLNKP